MKALVMKPFFTQIIVERDAVEDPLTERIVSYFSEIPVKVVSRNKLPEITKQARRLVLILMHQRGRFVKDFHIPPGAPPCGEKYIVSMLNCPFHCSYCYLQSYLDHGHPVIFTNRDKMKDEIQKLIKNDPPRYLTTGEYGDSLALDDITGTVMDLLPTFNGSDTMLEIRTKSDAIDHIIRSIKNYGYTGNLVITWTLAPENMVKQEERGTASLKKRLDAIRKSCTAGIKVGIRFDPVIPFYADMDNYWRLLQMISQVAEGDMINRFELGVLRFPPGLFNLIRKRKSFSPLLHGEFFKDQEDKIRLYRPFRVKIYRELHLRIRRLFPKVPVELSMEHSSVWEDSGVSLSEWSEHMTAE
jgi:spore photoproduct lyase